MSTQLVEAPAWATETRSDDQLDPLKPLSRPNVAIVAKAPSSRLMAPFDDPAWEVWGLSDAVSYVGEERWHRWFEVHDIARYHETYPWYWDWLTTQHGDRPIYVGRDDDPMIGHMPNACVFPTDYITRKYGRYFNNSVSYMIVLAIELGAEKIGLYGVDMAQDTLTNAEYSHQRPSCEYFIGLARGLGIEVIVPEESDLLKVGRLYGIEANRGIMDRKLRVRDAELSQRMASADHAREQAESQKQILSGALFTLDTVAGQLQQGMPLQQLTQWLSERKSQLEKEQYTARCQARDANQSYWMLKGAREDLQWARQWA